MKCSSLFLLMFEVIINMVDLSVKECLDSVTIPTPVPIVEQRSIVVCEAPARKTIEGILSYSNTDYRPSEELYTKIENTMSDMNYPVSFSIYDIESGVEISYNADRYIPSASTVKAPFVMTCIKQINDDKFSMEDLITISERNLYYADPGGLTKSSLGEKYTVEFLLDKTITVSDNIGYLSLQDFFGVTEYNNFLKSLGNKVTLDGRGVRWGSTSVNDSVKNWVSIYEFIRSDEPYADWFGDLLSSTTRSYARDELGSKYTVYNKMGWAGDDCCHEQAIIMAEKPYILIIMTENGSRNVVQKDMKNLINLLDELHTDLVGGI